MTNDLVAEFIGYLAVENPGMPVCSEVPADRPAEFVTVEPAGGTEDMFIQRPLMAVTAYSTSDYSAATLLRGVIGQLLAAPGALDLVCAVSVQSTYRAGLEDATDGWAAIVSVVANKI